MLPSSQESQSYKPAALPTSVPEFPLHSADFPPFLKCVIVLQKANTCPNVETEFQARIAQCWLGWRQILLK